MSSTTAKGRKIIITQALPYANASLHLGHILEAVQSDIWSRFQNNSGNECLFFCADDTHGTPVMLKAKEMGISPEKLIKDIQKDHEETYKLYDINFTNYHSTHSDENKKYSDLIYLKAKENGFITRNTINQLFDESESMFLSDRFVKGTCPKCGAEDQHGDNCSVCGATYDVSEIKDPISVISNTKPINKESEHLFFDLPKKIDALKEFLTNGDLQKPITNKLNEWLNDNLNDWDITRDAPYFGFKIPNEENKYFYVWVDAPIGYISAFEEYSKNNGNKFDGIWQNEDHGEIYHFIGKDIAYFHSLFWPSILNGAGYRTPNSIYCHGFLTVNGKKMSKSRGTFIKASDYLKHLDPEFLRYYFASRLNDSIEDIDLNFDDLTKKINSDLVGKLINLASRCSSFLEKNSDLMLSKKLENKEKFTEFLNDVGEIKRLYSQRKYSNAVNKIMSMTDKANQYINENKPWAMKDLSKVQEISTQGLNYFRSIIILLGPVMPDLLKKTENMLNENNLAWENCLSPLLDKK